MFDTDIERQMFTFATSRGNANLKIKPVPLPISRERIRDLGQQLTGEDRALWYYLYLTGCRISEAVGDPKNKQTGVTWNNIEPRPEHNLILVFCQTEKNKKAPFRKLPITMNPATIDGEMANEFFEFAKTKVNEKQIFSLTRQKAFNHFHKLKINVEAIENIFDPKNRRMIVIQDWRPHPHFLRHCRLTHLVELEEYQYDVLKLTAFAGWTNMVMATTYVHFNWRMLAEPIISNNTTNLTEQKQPEQPQALNSSENFKIPTQNALGETQT